MVDRHCMFLRSLFPSLKHENACNFTTQTAPLLHKQRCFRCRMDAQRGKNNCKWALLNIRIVSLRHLWTFYNKWRLRIHLGKNCAKIYQDTKDLKYFYYSYSYAVHICFIACSTSQQLSHLCLFLFLLYKEFKRHNWDKAITFCSWNETCMTD